MWNPLFVRFHPRANCIEFIHTDDVDVGVIDHKRVVFEDVSNPPLSVVYVIGRADLGVEVSRSYATYD